MRHSYSSLSTYKECPAKYSYRYIEKLPDVPSAAMPRIGCFADVLLKISTRPPRETSGLTSPDDSSVSYSRRSQKGIADID